MIYRFYGCLARKEHIKMFISDAEKRALDLEREQLVRALPSWTIMGESFNMPGPHSASVKGKLLGG